MAFCHRLRNRFVAQPGLYDDVRAKCEVPVQQHFFPDNGRHACGSHIAVIEVYKSLEQWLQYCARIRSDGVVKLVDICLDLVAAGVEIGAVRRYSW